MTTCSGCGMLIHQNGAGDWYQLAGGSEPETTAYREFTCDARGHRHSRRHYPSPYRAGSQPGTPSALVIREPLPFVIPESLSFAAVTRSPPEPLPCENCPPEQAPPAENKQEGKKPRKDAVETDEYPAGTLDYPVILPEPGSYSAFRKDEYGYRSPWYLGPLGGPDGGAEDYHAWRRARNEFTRTGDAAWKLKMLDHVTADSPPLASDLLPAPRRHRFDADKAVFRAGSIVIVILLIIGLICWLG